MGCDLKILIMKKSTINFNPRTHRGVRLYVDMRTMSISLFQSTHPSWGATSILSTLLDEEPKFQSTHPSWGATITPIRSLNPKKNFNPRTHRGVRRCKGKHHKTYTDFNPRTHRGVRQTEQRVSVVLIVISIHAPIVGCD